ncbi:coatomer protein complex, subunit epsilon (predicted), isoform CRA_e [Rattus norvegicus]|uniref:Coatomer protein complex, subunit epsilon (Predicted), isoform CRA_e n=1 Tax=Rattus norvegicus TaxID=10116 RepID=A6KA63_RAT|nr:coatomer protein complex, subunit epsilon (predicted), isoform CRA_e [Rattus norvegicus]EDL90678.1 coatomer protein complex, subunit epsilon (predicted), isoform CRA_e [Rattus norvegicus]
MTTSCFPSACPQPLPNVDPLPSLPQWRKTGDVIFGIGVWVTSQLSSSLMWSKETWCPPKLGGQTQATLSRKHKAMVPLPYRVNDENSGTAWCHLPSLW